VVPELAEGRIEWRGAKSTTEAFAELRERFGHLFSDWDFKDGG